MNAATTFDAAVRAGNYELAALRLLLGVVAALDDVAPAAREELMTLLTRPPASERPR